MPKSCAAYNCTNRYSSKNKELTFHRFPFSKPDLLTEWTNNVGRAEFKPNQHTVICSDHFKPECFNTWGNRKNLKQNAVPTVFHYPDNMKQRHRARKRLKITSDETKIEVIEEKVETYLTLTIGILFGVMFLINRGWRFCFQSLIRQHAEDVIYEINDSLYRATIVTSSENEHTRQHTSEEGLSIYKKRLTLYIEAIFPMDSCKCWLISICFVVKNVADCGVAESLVVIISLMCNSYEEEYQKCKIENRNLVCTIPEYHTFKYIQIIASVSSGIISLIILCLVLYTYINVKSRCNSFLKVYNCNIIPHYNYESLTLQCKSSAWGVILLYLE